MVASEVAQPNVIALLSESEGWSSVVRSSKEPGWQMDLQVNSDSELFGENQPGCRAPNHPVLHEDNGAFSNNPVCTRFCCWGLALYMVRIYWSGVTTL